MSKRIVEPLEIEAQDWYIGHQADGSIVVLELEEHAGYHVESLLVFDDIEQVEDWAN